MGLYIYIYIYMYILLSGDYPIPLIRAGPQQARLLQDLFLSWSGIAGSLFTVIIFHVVKMMFGSAYNIS